MCKLITVLLLTTSVCSCSFQVPQNLKLEFKCYKRKYSGLDTLINTHGFYNKMVIRDKTGLSGMKDGKFQELGIDTSYLSFVFFNDGIFISDIGASGLTVTEYLNNSAISRKSISGQLEGTYTINGDTLKTRSISYGFPNSVWYGYEVWYKIIDKNTIVDFYIKHLGLSVSDKNKQAYKPRFYTNAMHSKFVYVNNMPESSSWLDKENWFCYD